MILAALSTAAACAEPQRGDSVEPRISQVLYGSDSDRAQSLSLYEYMPGPGWRITGRRLHFAAPRSLLATRANLAGGPQTAITLRLGTERARRLLGLPQLDGEAFYARLSRYPDDGLWTEAALLQTSGENGIGPLQATGDRVCGLVVLTPTTSEITGRTLVSPSHTAYARELSPGVFDRITFCNLRADGTHRACRVSSSFRGFNLITMLSRRDVCASEDYVRQTERAFELLAAD